MINHGAASTVAAKFNLSDHLGAIVIAVLVFTYKRLESQPHALLSVLLVVQ